MWELADCVLDSFLTGGRGEFIGEFAGPFSLLVIADLLGVPEEDRNEFAAVLGRRSHAGALTCSEAANCECDRQLVADVDPIDYRCLCVVRYYRRNTLGRNMTRHKDIHSHTDAVLH
jgi:hypothetical protein